MSGNVLRFATVLVTVPTREVALKISRAVVHQKLAACVNIVPSVTSVYEWEGKIEESEELMLIVKTSEERIQHLQEKVLELHPYDVPEFIVLPIEHSSPAYGKWIATQTSKLPIVDLKNRRYLKNYSSASLMIYAQTRAILTVAPAHPTMTEIGMDDSQQDTSIRS